MHANNLVRYLSLDKAETPMLYLSLIAVNIYCKDKIVWRVLT